jgi:hypothetical protein
MKTKAVKIAGMDKFEHILVWAIVLGLVSYILVGTTFGIPKQPTDDLPQICGGLFLFGFTLSGFITLTSFFSGGVLFFDGRTFFVGKMGSEDQFKPWEIVNLKRSKWRHPPTNVLELKNGRTVSISLPFWLLSVSGKEDFIQNVEKRFKKINAAA